MDVIRLIAILVAVAVVVVYVLVNNVPANIHNYVTQPISIINKSLSEISSSVITPNIELNAQGLSGVLAAIKNGTGLLRMHIPSAPMNTTGGLTFEVPRIPTSINGTLGINVQSYNEQTMTLLVTNSLNCTVVINNITGNYITMNRQYTVQPQGTATVTLAITNAQALYQSYTSGKETITMNLTACGVGITTVGILGKITNVPLSIPNLGGGYVSIGVRNNYPFTVTLYNITGRYITLVSPVEVPPNNTAIAEFHVWNYTGFYTLYQEGEEVVNATVNLGGATMSSEFVLSRGINATPISTGGVLRIDVENPLGTEVTVYELSGQYIELANTPQVIPPGPSYITINVSNYLGLYRSIAMGNEDALLMLGVDGINLTTSIPLGSVAGPSVLRGAVLSMAVENPMNYAITIYNITSPSLHLINTTTIPPMGTAILRLLITNTTNPVGENVTIILGIMGVNLTEEFTIGSTGLEPQVIEVLIRNPLGVHMAIINITNQYIHLVAPVEIPPNSTGILRLQVTNASALNEYVNVTVMAGSTLVRLRVRP
ncbi:hypothetical protein [Vulcanisaeta souniana]|uniref:Uncharacterized protein n=1 Tax=Vulcanisaeta souniana JCM 11219 TaxID=1293586 RepID=A0A830E9E2_9CREN|nr:hypothetical protein [Vulcanisaeta souniana]BDR92720.1 hypothetical protein Vsou_18130 [Vulcanisaeta souniana JCM 11219]GGI84186.1 hypothetical protein GCM10007112_21380 [Vulcanisaeta souniana JCM 11219]